MSKLAQVFVVFIFILSIAFFGTSATLYKTRTDWRSAYNKLEASARTDLEKLAKKNDDLRAQLESLDKSYTGVKANQDELGNRLKQLHEDLKEEKARASTNASNAAKSAEAALNLSRTLDHEKASYAQLQESMNKVKSDLDNALSARIKAGEERDSMVLDLEKSQQEQHALKGEHFKLSEEFENMQLVLNALKARLGEDVLARIGSTAPQIDAVVKEVDVKEKLVLLSAGKDQKVQLGFEFSVYRGGEFIGTVKVIKVYPDLCGAEVVLTKDGAEIQKGDKASTQL